MKIAVVCANGRAGQKIVAEALSRNLDVTAIVRGENKSLAKKSVDKDILAITAEDLKNFDVVIDCFGAWTPETLPQFVPVIKNLCDSVANTNIRLLVVGGAGSLFTNPEHTLKVEDAPNFPDIFKPVSKAHGEILDYLRERKDVKWTYISPAADFQADGEKTWKYILAGEEFTLNEKNESVISYADYAVAMIDEATKGNHIQQRISVLRA